MQLRNGTFLEYLREESRKRRDTGSIVAHGHFESRRTPAPKIEKPLLGLYLLFFFLFSLDLECFPSTSPVAPSLTKSS